MLDDLVMVLCYIVFSSFSSAVGVYLGLRWYYGISWRKTNNKKDE
jgi:hypothetical protein